MKLKKGKGLFTIISTIITLILTLFFAGVMITFSAFGGVGEEHSGQIVFYAFTIISIIATAYLYWHGIKIIFKIDRNTWLYVAISFFAFFFGGVLMLIAKIID